MIINMTLTSGSLLEPVHESSIIFGREPDLCIGGVTRAAWRRMGFRSGDSYGHSVIVGSWV
jgi:hypothetical protein